MCGIYAVMQTSNNDTNAGQKVFAGLKRIEYRGYDSWGVATLDDENGFTINKQIGKLSTAKNILFPQATIALGHTRWATHGGVTQKNAHPHQAKNGAFVLVQNGVVDNYQELHKELKQKKYAFVSETDTEVIVGLLEQEMEWLDQKDLDREIVTTVFKRLLGRNTIAVLTGTGRILAVRNGSPLIVGKNKSGDIFLSSDVSSMSVDADEYIRIDSGQLVECELGAVKIYSVKDGKEIDAAFEPIEYMAQASNIGKYDNFMLKEIHEQAEVLSQVLKGKEFAYQEAVSLLSNADRVFCIGAGTASYVAGYMAYVLQKNSILAFHVPSYECESQLSLCTAKSVAIVFSQSGETADTNEVVEKMKEKKVKIISVVNMQGSTLSQVSDTPIMIGVGPELAVASTKAFLGHMVFSLTIEGLLRKKTFIELERELTIFEQQLQDWFANVKIQKKVTEVAEKLENVSNLFVLARGNLYFLGLECALKIKEIAYIHAEGFSGGELKHGMIALVEKGVPVICLVDDDTDTANMLNAVSQIKSRGAYTIGISPHNNELFDEWIEVAGSQKTFGMLSYVIPAQLMTCYIAQAKGFDVDKPRNLAKSVTVK